MHGDPNNDSKSDFLPNDNNNTLDEVVPTDSDQEIDGLEDECDIDVDNCDDEEDEED